MKGINPMNSSQAVRSLVRDLLFTEGYATHAPLHLRVRNFSRRPGFREAASQQRHLDLQGSGNGSKGGGAIGSGIASGSGGGADAKSSRMLARQHANIADDHAQAARNSRASDMIAGHRDAEDLHRTAAGHYHNAADSFRR
jgi:hypothetical protein